MNGRFPRALAVPLCLAVAACASSSAIPVAQDQFILSTSAAPACGRSGSAKVAAKMAAVETLRKGYPRFMIVGATSANNVRAIQTGPTYAYTTGTAQTFGNTTFGTATTTFGGGGVMFTGSHDRDLAVQMFRPGDAGYDRALDAKAVLGATWRELVEKGIHTCA